MTSETLWLVVWTIGWTLIGALGGYVLGRLAADVHQLANPNEGGRVNQPTAKEPRWRPAPQLIVGLLVVILGVGTAIQGIVVNNRVQQLQQCQARYSNRFADAIDARTTATNGSQRALDELVAAIGKRLDRGGKADQAAIAGALQRYLTQRDQSKQERAAHPYPEPPREACG
ncbi:MAG TPA: hypothetical protein DEQ00_04105 [Mycobacterium tuberculosis]|nr:hypothetical protein [Mycobacterium tuberculosis]